MHCIICDDEIGMDETMCTECEHVHNDNLYDAFSEEETLKDLRYWNL